MNILEMDTVALTEDNAAIRIIDQTLLPGTLQTKLLCSQQQIFDAIFRLEVRGAPAIGVCAAYGVYLAARDIEIDSPHAFLNLLRQKADFLCSARPTAVNLAWAVRRMLDCAEKAFQKGVPEIRSTLLKEAKQIHAEDTAVCSAIGDFGLPLIRPNAGILTHCNAGQLATTKFGTALSPIYKAHQRGIPLRVYADETRPLLQGARLTATELCSAGVDTTLLCDNMVSYAMMHGLIDLVFTGCDRVAKNGDAANKIGTSGVAVLAHHYHIPFYICAPLSTIDPSCPDGAHIPIEQRDASEVTDLWYKQRMAPDGVSVLNPAFDVTDHSLITGIITEKGILYPPFSEHIAALFSKNQEG